jgi:hypothetical protein
VAGEIKTAGKPYSWSLFDKRGNPVSKKLWVCRGNAINANGTYMNGLLDARRLERGGLYYWVVESKRGNTRHRYAHPFRMPTKPISAYADGKSFASRLRTRELPYDQPVKDAIAGKPPGKPGKPSSGGGGTSSGTLKPPSELAAVYDASGDGTPLVITFRNATSPLLQRVRVYWNRGSCPKISTVGDLAGARFINPATPGERVRIDDKIPSGSAPFVCVAAWSHGKNDETSAAVTATVQLPPGGG